MKSEFVPLRRNFIRIWKVLMYLKAQKGGVAESIPGADPRWRGTRLYMGWKNVGIEMYRVVSDRIS